MVNALISVTHEFQTYETGNTSLYKETIPSLFDYHQLLQKLTFLKNLKSQQFKPFSAKLSWHKQPEAILI